MKIIWHQLWNTTKKIWIFLDIDGINYGHSWTFMDFHKYERLRKHESSMQRLAPRDVETTPEPPGRVQGALEAFLGFMR